MPKSTARAPLEPAASAPEPTPTSRFHTVNGDRIHTRRAGAGPDLVLVHGLVASHRYWEPTLRHFARWCRTWAPDLPGHGRSPRRDQPLDMDERADLLAAWMDKTGIRDAHVMANSAGCAVAVALAARHPRRVGRLVLQGPVPDPHARSFLRHGTRWARAMALEPALPWRSGIRDTLDLGIRRSVQEVRLILNDPIEARLPDVRAPTLVVRGDRDPLVPQAWAEELVRRLPFGRLAVLPGAHLLNTNQPHTLGRVVLPFLGLNGARAET